jgi:hypothetical protein
MKRLVAGLLLLVLAGCSATGSSSPSTPAASNVAPTATPIIAPTDQPTGAPTSPPTAEPEPTADLGAFICSYPYAVDGNAERAQITDVRVGAHEGYDRIVFEFEKGIPAMDVTVGTPPFTKDPSGLPLPVDGERFLVFTLRGGTGITPDGRLTYDGPTDFTPGFVPDHPPLVQLVQAGDFEAQSVWVAGLTTPVGLTEPGCMRVFALSDPDRLVIDLAAP